MDKQMSDQNIDQEKQENSDKTKNKLRSGRKSSLDFRKYTQQIWLAGLGAFSRAEEEGNKLFDSLVKVGEELENQKRRKSLIKQLKKCRRKQKTQ